MEADAIPGLAQKALAVIPDFQLSDSSPLQAVAYGSEPEYAPCSSNFGVIFDKALKAYKQSSRKTLPFIPLPPNYKHVILSVLFRP
jgi:hypothetical protein